MNFTYNKTKTKFKLEGDTTYSQFLTHSYVYFYNSKFLKDLIGGNLRNSVQSEASYQKKLEAQIKQKSNFVYLYSDEATGYRNAVDQDLKILSKLKKKIPSLMLGGFGNLFDLEKGRSLYKSWDVGLYHDMTSSNDLVLLNQWHKQWGL